jgi:hypothetical protein
MSVPDQRRPAAPEVNLSDEIQHQTRNLLAGLDGYARAKAALSARNAELRRRHGLNYDHEKKKDILRSDILFELEDYRRDAMLAAAAVVALTALEQRQ